MFTRYKEIFWVGLIFALMVTDATAGTATGLPWENPLQTITNSITGPVALAISLIAIVITGAMLIWGGEVNDFARKLIIIVLVIALIVAATNVLTTLFGATGAVI
ncbi:MAG: conjugal transfer protein TrbC [Sedimenticola sp.]|uniref:Conjugal transfer protein TrbC n=2 Tax=Sedimenticola TaxID=349742 RepID=A0A558CLR3_9GAMM|nr:TrbC/VirB2 family protein [Sedimenticola selenatireducens]PLY12868.1 MAG: conjugal transfer protein TrbC [Sedimenticola sp.]TVO69690.1 conjugal transfer protein TrbC [Sedimenticola selenatireducens]TVT49679.1 MAG: conjugal transfer protein TrbC [Sedimenticola thiotaurini]TVT62242.1 MAG: conjugal transfer protein TrbC [Sedimenticola selenatireducens]